MNRLAAFLRGINLGNRRVKMDRLREHFRDMGLEEVVTYRASGNVVFRAPNPDRDCSELEAEIESHLAGALGYRVETFVRSPAELERLVGLEVVTTGREAGFTPYVIFLREIEDRVVEALKGLETRDDRFHALDREVVYLRRGRLTDSAIGPAELEAALDGSPYTRRKMTTVEGLAGKFGLSPRT